MILSFLRNIIRVLPYLLLTLPRLVVFRVGMYLSRRRKGQRTNMFHEIGFVGLSVFGAVLASLTILPQMEITARGIKLAVAWIPRINLVPFARFSGVGQGIDGGLNPYFLEILANMAMFAIIGFMLPLLWKRFENVKVTILTCVLIAFTIEFVQLFLPAASDIDEFLMNTLGGIIGFYAYRLVQERAPDIAAKFKYTDSIGA